jgi:uracil-DNA glycosylase family 4
VPPDNKPTGQEVATCLPYLAAEMEALKHIEGIVLLGRIAMDGLIELYRDQGIILPKVEFAHAKVHRLGGSLPWWITSYHPSRQNTQTGRLTEAMFDEVWIQARELLAKKAGE